MSTGFGNASPRGGSIGELVRTMDWTASPLGPPAQWPPALSHSFSLCLDSPFIMAIYWGPEFYLLYGDGYLPAAADKHPWSFGRRAREVWPEIWDVIGPQLQRVMLTGQAFLSPVQRLDMHQHGALQERYFSYSFVPIRDKHGRVCGVLNTAQEVTAQVRTERARKETQAALDLETAMSAQTRNLLQMVTDGTTDAIYVKDTAGRTVHANSTVCRLLGRPLAQILGRDDSVWFPPEQAARIMDNDRAVMASRRTQVFEEEVQVMGPDGRLATRLYLASKTPWIAADGTLLGLFGIARDITERKEQEDAQRQVNEMLEARVAERTRERDRIWRVSREIFVVLGRDGLFTSVNPAFERVLGWTFEEATRQPFTELLHPDDVLPTLREFEQLLSGVTRVGYECRFLHKDGSYRWLNWTAVPEGDTVYAVGRDVTDEHAQAETLARAEEQLRQSQKMEAVGQLTGGLAHDFNNLLAAIMTSLELMQRRLDAGQLDDLPRYLNSARSSTQRAASLTQRLLAFSRRQSLDPQPVNINELVFGMEDLMQRTLGESIALRTRLDPSLPSAFTDPHQLENALLNLAINARDAMPQGGLLTISTALVRMGARSERPHCDLEPGDYLMLDVSDTGSGMTPEVAAKAFDPFFTTKPIGQGTGLGLSMIYGYVRQSGGNVAIDSEPGVGTSVKLYLPRWNQEPGWPLEAVAAQDTPAAASTPLGAGQSVLVVEDEAIVRGMVIEVLTELGYAAHEAGDAAAALRLVDSGVHLDLLVTDVGLPGTNGRQLAEMVRARRPGLKVLFVTGYARPAEVRGEFLDVGMDMLTKPFAIEELARKIEDMLR